jgi:hypothetical protein
MKLLGQVASALIVILLLASIVMSISILTGCNGAHRKTDMVLCEATGVGLFQMVCARDSSEGKVPPKESAK